MFAAPMFRRSSNRLPVIAAAVLIGLLTVISPALSMFPAPAPAPKPAAAAAAPASTAAPAESAQRLPRVRKAEAAPMEGASCSSARQKLWVEGEGWVVRRVNRCW